MSAIPILSCALSATFLLPLSFRPDSSADPARPADAGGPALSGFRQTAWNLAHATIVEQEGDWIVSVAGQREHHSPSGLDCALVLRSESDGALHHYDVPLGGEVVVTPGWIVIGHGGLVRGFAADASGCGAVALRGQTVFPEADVEMYELAGGCWKSAPFIPPCCDFVLVCGEGPYTADCELTIDLVEGDGEIFSSQCGGGLQFELCANGGNPVFRVHE